MQARNEREEFEHIIAGVGPYWSYHFDFAGRRLIPIEGYDLLLRRLVRIIADFTKKPIAQLRILDLGCMEGYFGLMLARLGAEVVGVEIRDAHLARANFGRKFLGLEDKVVFFKNDVRKVHSQTYGSFDVVIAAGIFYHLDAPDNIIFLKTIREITADLVIVDTHIALSRQDTFEFEGKKYFGILAMETPKGVGQHLQDQSYPHASYDTEKSFWLTESSLLNAFINTGYASLYKAWLPRVGLAREYYDRLTIVAKKNIAPEEQMMPVTEKLAANMAEQLEGNYIIHPNNNIPTINMPGRVLPPDFKISPDAK